jgi:2-iminobutanoate/2-iminopropanoate deaminase
MKKIISTSEAPQAIGPYSQAVLARGVLYTAGQIAIVPETGAIELSNIRSETHQVMKNLKGVLAAAKMNFSNVVKSTIFLKDMAQYAAINEVYSEYFSEKPPAREAVQVSQLPKNVNIEISLIAVL